MYLYERYQEQFDHMDKSTDFTASGRCQLQICVIFAYERYQQQFDQMNKPSGFTTSACCQLPPEKYSLSLQMEGWETNSYSIPF